MPLIFTRSRTLDEVAGRHFESRSLRFSTRLGALTRTKLLDPAAARAREEELGVVVETPKRDDASVPPDLVCRICSHRRPHGPFCPVCLAETMEREVHKP